MSNRQIAVKLGIAEGTIKRHMRNIFTKLDAVSRIDAVNKAVERGLLPQPDPPRRRF
ncbi:helix-turn-helix transcriptional regulator [Streptomyces sp. NPDC048213]